MSFTFPDALFSPWTSFVFYINDSVSRVSWISRLRRRHGACVVPSKALLEHRVCSVSFNNILYCNQVLHAINTCRFIEFLFGKDRGPMRCDVDLTTQTNILNTNHVVV